MPRLSRSRPSSRPASRGGFGFLDGDAGGRIASRLLFARGVFWVAMVLLVVRFWSLQVARGEEFVERARSNYVATERTRAPRGLVVDRRGVVLAESRPFFRLTAGTEGLDQLEAIGHLDVSPEERAALRRQAARQPAVVRPLTFEAASWYMARRRELPDVRVDFVPVRVYPMGAATAHLLGHVGEVTGAQLLLEEFAGSRAGDQVGQDGVERMYNEVLAGQDGRIQSVVDSRQRVLVPGGISRVEPVRGRRLTLSAEAAIQRAGHEAFGSESGAFVALDLKTGGVLGLGSFPAFDAGPERAPGVWRALLNNPMNPLLNRATQGKYPPGSTFKLITAAAALGEGVADASTRFTCRGRARVAGRTFACHRESGHGSVSLVEALKESCNVFFYRLSQRLDVDVLARYARAFGLGAATGVDLTNETTGLVPSRDWKRRVHDEPWYASETASLSVGQGPLEVTPMQMARLAAAVATSGTLFQPRLVGVAPSGRVTGLAPERFALIREGMRAAVEDGTARRAALEGVQVSGKTGTAQVAGLSRIARDNADRPRELRTHAWFVGFAPHDDPEIAVAAIVEHSGGGGVFAAPVARAVFDAWFQGRREEGGGAGDVRPMASRD